MSDPASGRRSFWTRLLFLPSGEPRKLLRLMLFRADGKLREALRKVVLHSNGRPRGPFRRWMLNPARLRQDFDGRLTPRARRIHAELKSAMARRRQEHP